MADFASALRSRLIGDPDVQSAAGPRVYWNIVPQGASWPNIRLQVVSDVRPMHLTGRDASRQTRVQCDCLAQKYGDARQLAEFVIEALDGTDTVSGVRFGSVGVDGPRDLGEDVEGVGFIHRMSLDLLVEHTPA